jgi:hypothetical protein
VSVSPKLVGNAVDNSRGKVQNVVIDSSAAGFKPELKTTGSTSQIVGGKLAPVAGDATEEWRLES